MAQDFGRRIEFLILVEFLFVDKMKFKDQNRFLKGELVLALDYLFLHYFKNKYKDSFDETINEGFDFHISRSGGGMKPYFVILSQRMTDSLIQHFNIT